VSERLLVTASKSCKTPDDGAGIKGGSP
jgi:hypothetical protein